MWWFEVVHGAVFNIPVDVSAEVDKAEESQVDMADGSAVDVEVVELIWGQHGWSTWQSTQLVNVAVNMAGQHGSQHGWSTWQSTRLVNTWVSAVNMANAAGQCGGQHD